MIPFKDCEYSLFISYAHDDDSSEFGWVQSLRNAISQRLDKLDNDIPKLGLHLSQENGPSAGTLGSELRDRVAKSFGMLLVIGEKYVSSEWCEKELKFFCEAFGNDGLQSRLYIAVMSEPAVQRAQLGEQWKKVMPTDQLWVPMFDEIDRARPLEHTKRDGSPGFPGAFVKQASRIADKLITEIERDYAESKKQLPPPGLPRTAEAGVTTAAKPGARKQVVIGPYTASLAGKVEAIRTALENAGADVTVLDKDAIADCDPDDGRPLRPLLAHADVLVVPVTLERPLQPAFDGGHTTILKREWLAAGKAERDLAWYRPADIVVAPADMAAERHQKCFSELAPVCFSETALVAHLFGIGTVAAIRIHIENHPQAHAFKSLSRKLEDAWSRLKPDPARPMLRCVALDLDDLANASKDVAGVVLLLPVPLKDPRALLAQIDQVQRLIPMAGTYPGCVAILYKPPLGEVPKHEWMYVNIEKSDPDEELRIEQESEVDLKEFLVDLWERYRRSAAAGVLPR